MILFESWLGKLAWIHINEKVIDGCTYTLDCENGEKSIDTLIAAFSEVCE